MDGWIPKGRVQIKADTCSNMKDIYGFFDEKSSRQYHSKDIHRNSLIQFYSWMSFFGRPEHIYSTNSLQDYLKMTSLDWINQDKIF